MNLYEITGNITDINTLLVPKLEFDDLRTALAKAEQERDAAKALVDLQRVALVASDMANDALNAKLATLAAQEPVKLTPLQKRQMWIDATIEMPSPENCYLRGIADAERAIAAAGAAPRVYSEAIAIAEAGAKHMEEINAALAAGATPKEPS